MSTGDITDGPYASRSKEYIWSRIRDVFPRSITPSDFDSVVECNRCFFVFEGKTSGTDVQTGQGLCLKRAIEAWPLGRSVLVLGSHPQLKKVDMAQDITEVRYGYRTGAGFRWAPQPVTGVGCLWAVAQMFVADAEGLGHLEPESWGERFEVDSRPFIPPLTVAGV